MFHYKILWNYKLSPKLSDHLNLYKTNKSKEYLIPPPVLNRGSTTIDVLRNSSDETECREMIQKWGRDIYKAWNQHHDVVDTIAKGFVEKNKAIIRRT